MDSAARINKWMEEIRVIDGGMGSECQKRSHLSIEGHKAWSCRLLKDDPNLVCDIHKSYIRAGCDVICTNTYQAAPHTLADALGVSTAEAVELMRHAVRLARRAICTVSQEERLANRKLPILVAGSLGPYGACAADGSEYSGSYVEKMSFTDLVCFHKTRAEILIQAGVDLLAWETIPVVAEVAAICEVMRRLPSAAGWLTVASSDGQTTVGGDPLNQVALEVQNCHQIFGIGVNCCIPHALIGQALANLASIPESCEAGNEDGFHPPPCSVRHKCTQSEQPPHRKILILNANSGEMWMPLPGKGNKRRGHWIWPKSKGPAMWSKEISKWTLRRLADPLDRAVGSSNSPLIPLAQWVGGCCRVGPEQINSLARWMKPDEYRTTLSESPEANANHYLQRSSAKRRSSSVCSSGVKRKYNLRRSSYPSQ
ncbi:unnamed protein product [Calicophoron daubneyi]|uniref:Hcy-binding domain-containing protein n=1 Tax=Calicophoron daubneyi TaxID=300641 RepID=A0AAV2TS83_CALDB